MGDFGLGAVDIARVEEWDGWPAPTSFFFPDTDDSVWRAHEQLLGPEHWDPATGLFRATMQSWLLRHGGRTILVDTGVGNDKQRLNPAFHEQRFPYLERLAAAGAQPEDVDTVLLTHLHVDHVGGATTLLDGQWVPRFPNATYVVHRADLEFWDPANGHEPRGGDVNAGVWDDSIAPLLDAGVLQTWDADTYRVDDAIELAPAPGHTPGSAVVRVESGGEHGVFLGDLAHSPLQLAETDLCTCFCEDPPAAARARRAVFDRAAADRAVVFPGHFGASRALEIRRDGAAFDVARWVAPAPARVGA